MSKSLNDFNNNTSYRHYRKHTYPRKDCRKPAAVLLNNYQTLPSKVSE